MRRKFGVIWGAFRSRLTDLGDGKPIHKVLPDVRAQAVADKDADAVLLVEVSRGAEGEVPAELADVLADRGSTIGGILEEGARGELLADAEGSAGNGHHAHPDHAPRRVEEGKGGEDAILMLDVKHLHKPGPCQPALEMFDDPGLREPRGARGVHEKARVRGLDVRREGRVHCGIRRLRHRDVTPVAEAHEPALASHHLAGDFRGNVPSDLFDALGDLGFGFCSFVFSIYLFYLSIPSATLPPRRVRGGVGGGVLGLGDLAARRGSGGVLGLGDLDPSSSPAKRTCLQSTLT
jgi:hypothetical protein